MSDCRVPTNTDNCNFTLTTHLRYARFRHVKVSMTMLTAMAYDLGKLMKASTHTHTHTHPHARTHTARGCGIRWAYSLVGKKRIKTNCYTLLQYPTSSVNVVSDLSHGVVTCPPTRNQGWGWWGREWRGGGEGGGGVKGRGKGVADDC